MIPVVLLLIRPSRDFGADGKCVVYIGQNRNRSAIDNRRCHRNPHISGDNHFLSWPNSQRSQGNSQGSGTTAHRNHVRHFEKLANLRFECFDFPLQVDPIVTK